MKKQVILILLLLPYLQVVANPPNDKILFIEGNLPQVAHLAATEGKLYFIHVTAQWCMPCQWMEKNTFNNPQLARFVNEHYLAVKIDIDQPEGQNFKKQYLITNLPSILVFNAKGQLKARWETSLDADQLLQILQKHNTVLNRQSDTVPGIKPTIMESPKPVFATALTTPKPNFAEQAPVTAIIEAASSEFSSNLASSSPIFLPNTTFGIQVGVFSNYNNAVGEVIRLETKIKQPIQLVTSANNGKQLYKVIVGRFNDRMNASAFLSQLRRYSINGIIKELD